MTQVAAHHPVAPQRGPSLGVVPGEGRWKPAGAVIPPGSGAPGRANLTGANLGPGAAALASREPPTGSGVLREAASKPE